MAKEVRLPQLGQTMEEGTIVECRVKLGDEVEVEKESMRENIVKD